MSNLEEQIRNNRSAFDDAELPKGHIERFENRLGGKRKPSWRRSYYWAGAAVIALIVMIRVLEPDHESIADQPNTELKMKLADNSPKMAEVEAYFSTQIKDTYLLVQATSANKNGKMELLIRHLNELEKNYEELKEELYRHPNDTRILNRMIENYRLRLNLLERHLTQLNQSSKNSENENV